MIGTPAKTSVARGRKSGRLLGEKQVKRESLDIVFKSKAAIQKKLKSIITETENKRHISKPEKITSIIKLVQKEIFRLSLFCNLLRVFKYIRRVLCSLDLFTSVPWWPRRGG